MWTKLLLGTGILSGLSSAAIHWSWEHSEDEIHHPDGQYLGGTCCTYYNFSASTKEPSSVRVPLAQNVKTPYDVCVIGGGYAGLHTALALAERGKKVVILEGKRIGSGASGRNGGDALIGFHTSVDEIAEWTRSKEKAKELFKHSEDGYDRLKSLINKYRIQCDSEEQGALTLSFTDEKRAPASDEAFAEEIQEVNEEFNQKLEFKSKTQLREEIGFDSERYRCGIFEPRNTALNPLELCFGLARACEQNGVVIHEGSKVVGVNKDIQGNFVTTTSMGSVKAKHCVLATNHAPWNISRRLAMRSTPISTCAMLTSPLPKEKLDKCIEKQNQAFFDDRFGLAYFRRVEGDRLVYGCFASGMPMLRRASGGTHPSDYTTHSHSTAVNGIMNGTEAKMRKSLIEDLSKTFPSLANDIRVERWWSGRLQTQYPIFPLVGKESHSGMYYSLAFAGHGIVPTCAAGMLLSSAICDGDTRYELWDEVVPSWMPPGGGPTGYLGATAACAMLRWYDAAMGRK